VFSLRFYQDISKLLLLSMLERAASAAVSSLDYLQQPARKKQITSRFNSGERCWSSAVIDRLREMQL
jgi:hypothetical protein